MRDQIIQGLLKDFQRTNSLNDLSESEAFEHFANYCVASQILTGNFDFEEIRTGGHGEVGIDGLAILVNEHLALSETDVDFFKKKLNRLDVQFVLIQSKTSDSFDLGSIGKFFFGAKEFFKRISPIASQSERIVKLHAIKEYIYGSPIDFETNPECSLYYVTTGEWKNDLNLTTLVENNIRELEETKLFKRVSFTPVDSERLKKMYRALRSKIVKVVSFEKHTILPKIERIDTAYIGVLPCSEYLKLICDEDGKLDRRLFYDNVRDFQGNNRVNQEIAQTLQSEDARNRFALLNNGVTIVAKSVNQTGTSFTIRDFQIVNGCQTSHVLYNNREDLTNGVYLPLKLIITEDAETTNGIIQATNSQTEVKKEAFESLSPFHKDLEQFYETFDEQTGKKLYYERRSRQYDAYPNIDQDRIVSLASQMKSFLAMFLNNPHSTHRYYGDILEHNHTQIFNDSHEFYPYYVSSYALFVLDRFFREKRLDPRYKPFRYHLLLIYRIQNEIESLPPLNSKKIVKYCERITDMLWNEDLAHRAYAKAIETLVNALEKTETSWMESSRRKAFTEKIATMAKQNSIIADAGAVATVMRETGKVERFSDIRGYGFINADNGNSRFVHHSKIQEAGYRSLSRGERVSYVVLHTEKGDQAQDVSKLGRDLFVINRCPHEVSLAIRYRHTSGEWETSGWWTFEPNESYFLEEEDVPVTLREEALYYYAETESDSVEYFWEGDEVLEYHGEKLPMRKTVLSTDEDGDYILTLEYEAS